MGARFGTECYADAATAAAAQCATLSGVTSAGVLHCTGVGGTTGAPVLLMQSQAPGAEPVAFELAIAVQECDPFERYADIAQMWAWAVPAVLAVLLVKHFVYRLVMPQ